MEGWEKQYQYRDGKKKVYMAPSAAEAQGLERVSKYPKSTKYGRQNPITARWNSEEQLVLWRIVWADTVNRCLERSGHKERVDHRSHAERGLDEQATIHEGVVARVLEQKGIISDRCELNRQIRAILKITDTALVGTGITRPARCLMQVGILRADDIRPYKPSFLIRPLAKIRYSGKIGA